MSAALMHSGSVPREVSRNREGNDCDFMSTLCPMMENVELGPVWAGLHRWWAVTTEAEYLGSSASRRSLWKILLPLPGLVVMFADHGKRNLVVLDAVAILFLWLLAFLPPKNLLSDFAIMVAATGFVMSHHVFSTTEGEDGFHHAEIVVLFSVAAAGMHSLVLLAYVIIVFTVAPYVASHYDTAQLCGCLYILLVSGICEFQVADFAWRTGWHSQLPHQRPSHLLSRGIFLSSGTTSGSAGGLEPGYKAMTHSHVSRDGGVSYDAPTMSRQGYPETQQTSRTMMRMEGVAEDEGAEDNWRSFAPPGSAQGYVANEFGHTRRSLGSSNSTGNLSHDGEKYYNGHDPHSSNGNNSILPRGKENSHDGNANRNELMAGRPAALSDPGLEKAAGSWASSNSTVLNSKMLESSGGQAGGARLPRPTGTPDLVLPRVGLQESTDFRSLPSAGTTVQRRLEDTQVKQPSSQQAPSPREPSPKPLSTWPVGTKTVAREKAPAKWDATTASPDALASEGLVGPGRLSSLFKKRARAPSPTPQPSPNRTKVEEGPSGPGGGPPDGDTVRAVKLTGFEIAGLNDTYVEDSSLEFMVNGRETYWSSSGDWFLYRNEQGNTWALAKAKRFTDVRAGDNTGGVAYAPEGFDIWTDGPNSSVRRSWHEYDSRAGKWKKSENSGVESRGQVRPRLSWGKGAGENRQLQESLREMVTTTHRAPPA